MKKIAEIIDELVPDEQVRHTKRAADPGVVRQVENRLGQADFNDIVKECFERIEFRAPSVVEAFFEDDPELDGKIELNEMEALVKKVMLERVGEELATMASLITLSSLKVQR